MSNDENKPAGKDAKWMRSIKETEYKYLKEQAKKAWMLEEIKRAWDELGKSEELTIPAFQEAFYRILSEEEPVRRPERVRGCVREICSECGRISSVGFHVPDDIWSAAVPNKVDVLCLRCFTLYADNKYLAWDKEIEFYPISKRTHRETLQAPLTDDEKIAEVGGRKEMIRLYHKMMGGGI